MRTPSGMLFLQPKKEDQGKHIYYQRKDTLDQTDVLPFVQQILKRLPQKRKIVQLLKSYFYNYWSTQTYRFAVAGTAEYTAFWETMMTLTEPIKKTPYPRLPIPLIE